MKQVSPIFFIGEGRSGTTIIFEAFSKHKDIAYLSNYTEKFWLPQFGIIHRIIKKQGKKNQYNDVSIINKFYHKPTEAYNTWEKLCGSKIKNHFMRDVRPTNSEIENVKKYINRIVKYQGKARFSTKLTGPPRITYFSSIFDDIYFINIIRDPRAVVASLLNVAFWKNRGNYPFWEDTLTKNKYTIWENYGMSQVALASLEWCSVYEQTIKEAKNTNSFVYNLKYEDFMDDPKTEMEKLLLVVGLSYCRDIHEYVKSNTYKNMNYRYKERLNDADIRVIEEICKEYMVQLNYL